MFLDEPTSGLDSAMAQEVIGNLRALQVKQGCTFVVTIHQPAPVVFDAFNRLVLLNLGRLAYWGDGRTAPFLFLFAPHFPRLQHQLFYEANGIPFYRQLPTNPLYHAGNT